MRAYHYAQAVLIRWACDCAERALLREREAGREPDIHSWKAVEVARQYAQGDFGVNAAHATTTNVYAAAAAAHAAAAAATAADAHAAYAAASAAAYAAYGAAYAAVAAYAAAAYAAAAYAARSTDDAVTNAEIEWKRKHLDKMMGVLYTNA